MRYADIDPKLFIENRHRLRAELEAGQVVVLRAAKPVTRSYDTEYPYSQDRNFFWATGIDQPDSLVVISKEDETLYVRPTNQFEKVWIGERLSFDEASRISGIATVKPLGAYRKPTKVFDASKVLAELRMVKTDLEIELIKRAIAVTAEGFKAAKKMVKAGVFEYEIEAEMTREFNRVGASHAYSPIIASGRDATYLHYIRNDKKLKQGELLLIDAGAEYANYAADITRVFPVGEFTPRQREVYEAVKRAKKFAEGLLKPGALVKECEEQIAEKMGEELKNLGLKFKSVREYYPHGTSHFLGLDVHDAGNYQKPLEPGVVLTCEPGIYIREEGIGVRLEDDILIKKTGNENLSKSIPL